MKGKLAIVISQSGIEAITIMGNGTEERTAGRSLCQFLEDEITNFESAIKMKIGNINGLKVVTTQ